jgi:hypothetical protein
MSNNIEISSEQGQLLEASVQIAVDLLLETGNFVPTLYVHDGSEMTCFNFAPTSESPNVRDLARIVIRDRAPDSVAYALLYDSALETDKGLVDVLIVETGDADENDAHEFVRTYSRSDQKSSPRLARLGPTPNILKPG